MVGKEEVCGLTPGEAPRSDFLDLGLSAMVSALQAVDARGLVGALVHNAGKRWNSSLLACPTMSLV